MFASGRRKVHRPWYRCRKKTKGNGEGEGRSEECNAARVSIADKLWRRWLRNAVKIFVTSEKGSMGKGCSDETRFVWIRVPKDEEAWDGSSRMEISKKALVLISGGETATGSTMRYFQEIYHCIYLNKVSEKISWSKLLSRWKWKSWRRLYRSKERF